MFALALEVMGSVPRRETDFSIPSQAEAGFMESCYCAFETMDAEASSTLASTPDITMTRQQLLDLYFMDARAKLIDLAAFFDRVDRGEGEADFRLAALKQAISELSRSEAGRAERVLLSLSDLTVEPIAKAPGKGAVGAFHR